MLLRKSMPALFLCLFLVACGGSDDPAVVDPVDVVEHEFYFDACFTNAVGGYQMYGTYVDSRGTVVSYDHSFGVWSIASPLSVSVAELEDKFSTAVDTLGLVDPAVLAGMYAKVAAASRGELVGSGYTGGGPGIFTYGCHVYDDAIGGYVLVVFSQLGDFPQTNNAPEAAELTAWLDGLVPARTLR